MKRSILAALILGLAAFPSSSAERKQGVAKARKGAVELTLRLHNTQLKRGEPIWFQVEVKNLGKEPFQPDDAFFGIGRKFLDSLNLNTDVKRGIYLVIKDSAGHPLKPEFPIPYRCWEHIPVDTDAYFEKNWRPVDPKVEKRIAGWRAQGLGTDEIQRRLDKEREKTPREVKPDPDDLPPYELLPGRSIHTPTWVFPGICKGDRPAAPKPPEGFAELIQVGFDPDTQFSGLEPGSYTIVGAYNNVPDKTEIEVDRKIGRPTERGPWRIRLATPPIAFTVAP